MSWASFWPPAGWSCDPLSPARGKLPLVVRAAPSLKEAAAAYYGAPEVSYDQAAFFLQGCLPLLYGADAEGHPMLALAQGLVAPEIYGEAERRLDASRRDLEANAMTQTLSITGLTDLVADAKSGRAAARLGGYITVTLHRREARLSLAGPRPHGGQPGRPPEPLSLLSAAA